MAKPKFTQKGDFYFDDDSGLWKPADGTRALIWQIVLIQEYFKPNKSGVSDFVAMDKIIERFPNVGGRFGSNGSDAFTRGLLAQNFQFNDEECVIRREGNRNGRVTHRRSIGLVTKRLSAKDVRPDIHKEIASRPCALSGTKTRVEVDHKDGRKADVIRAQTKNQRIDDFQPLCAVGNLIKREACSRCKHTDQRFDARGIGYPVGWVKGDGVYRGSCEGCYWYDIIAFRGALSMGKSK